MKYVAELGGDLYIGGKLLQGVGVGVKGGSRLVREAAGEVGGVFKEGKVGSVREVRGYDEGMLFKNVEKGTPEYESARLEHEANYAQYLKEREEYSKRQGREMLGGPSYNAWLTNKLIKEAEWQNRVASAKEVTGFESEVGFKPQLLERDATRLAEREAEAVASKVVRQGVVQNRAVGEGKITATRLAESEVMTAPRVDAADAASVGKVKSLTKMFETKLPARDFAAETAKKLTEIETEVAKLKEAPEGASSKLLQLEREALVEVEKAKQGIKSEVAKLKEAPEVVSSKLLQLEREALVEAEKAKQGIKSEVAKLKETPEGGVDKFLQLEREALVEVEKAKQGIKSEVVKLKEAPEGGVDKFSEISHEEFAELVKKEIAFKESCLETKIEKMIGKPYEGSLTELGALDIRLAYEELLPRVQSSNGRIVAGAGTPDPIKDINRLTSTYGGTVDDWVKMSTTAQHSFKNHGYFHNFDRIIQLELHWYENTTTGRIVEVKPKIVIKKIKNK